jgi:nucleoside-diphosphate-sugar epimerase
VNPARDFTYVKDTVKGFIEISKAHMLAGEVTNIGMNEEISIEQLVALIAKLMERKVNFVRDSYRIRPDQSEVTRLRCNNSKLLKNTNWKPEYNLQQGLLETIEWIKSNFRFYKSGVYNV